MIFAADLGGTKCNLALFRAHGSQVELVAKRRYSTAEFGSQPFESLVERFTSEVNGLFKRDSIEAACIGGAGAVVDGILFGTFVPWKLEREALARHFGLSRFALINDVEATALSLPCLSDKDFVVVNEGSPPKNATRALLAAGTGLGEAILFWDGARYHALPTEGGEADFSPSTDQEVQLLQALRKRLPRVSAEEILSGSGFRRIHEFLGPDLRHSSFDRPGGAAQQISELALSGACTVCQATLDLWISAYGSEAGNLALRTLAYGGIFVAGGIAAKILPRLTDGAFYRAFSQKGRYAPILARIPVRVITNEDAPLWGAAYAAFLHQ